MLAWGLVPLTLGYFTTFRRDVTYGRLDSTASPSAAPPPPIRHRSVALLGQKSLSPTRVQPSIGHGSHVLHQFDLRRGSSRTSSST